MKLRYILDTSFQDYKKISMVLGTCFCDFKCCVGVGKPEDICQNFNLISEPIIDIPDSDIIKRYLSNTLTEAIVISGMEPFIQINEVLSFIRLFRDRYSDDIIVYSGYQETEIYDQIESLKQFQNIIIKVGRFIPNSDKKFDEILGVTLASSNQYAIKL